MRYWQCACFVGSKSDMYSTFAIVMPYVILSYSTPYHKGKDPMLERTGKLGPCLAIMMTSWNGNIFRVTGPLWNLPVIDGFPSHRPETRSFDVYFDLCLNKRFSKQSRRRWFETASSSLWRHSNDGLGSWINGFFMSSCLREQHFLRNT